MIQNDKVFLKKFIITPEQALIQKDLFDPIHYGNLSFFCVISYQEKNTFLTFYCKSSKIPSKIFLFCKYSCGLESRDKIRAGKLPVVPSRGRCKTQLQNLNNKFLKLKSYISEFFKIHSDYLIIERFNILFKIYKLDLNIHNLITQDFDLSYKKKNSNKITSIPILKQFSLKFPHNGCRPKKVRRLKKSRK